MTPLALGKFNTNAAIKALLVLRKQNSRPFSKKISGVLRFLLTIFGVSLGKTSSTSKKKPKIGHFTLNISNLSYQNSILSGLLTN